MRDLEVEDVDVELAREREHLGGSAGAVRDRDAHLDEILGLAGTPRQVRARRTCRVERAEQRVAVLVGDHRTDLAELADEAVEHGHDRIAVERRTSIRGSQVTSASVA